MGLLKSIAKTAIRTGATAAGGFFGGPAGAAAAGAAAGALTGKMGNGAKRGGGTVSSSVRDISGAGPSSASSLSMARSQDKARMRRSYGI